MKILKLRFKNLNSLYGEWEIDFSAPEYVSNGIFAITGPTGSGKSTVLDAICLALYGQTPRLSRINKSGNDIMSRQTGECFAEVTFEAQTGRFVCHWSQQRANKKAAGNLQDAKHEIANAKTGDIIESKKKDVAAVIEKTTGMDFERFTRSILLAQGGFSAFLQADPDKRAPILEQITGTEIYTEISKRVHEKHRDEKLILNELQSEVRGITILSAADEVALANELSVKQQENAELILKQQEVQKSVLWLEGIEQLQADINKLSTDIEGVLAEIKDFEPERDKLSKAQTAAAFDGAYATLSAIRKQQKADEDKLVINQKQLLETKDSVEQATALLKSANDTFEKAKAERTTLTPVIQTIRILDLQLANNLQALTAAEADCQKVIKQISEHKANKTKLTTSITAAQNEAVIVDEYLTVNSADEMLTMQLGAIEFQLNQLQTIQQEVAAKKAALVAAEAYLTSIIEAFKSSTGKLAKLANEHEQAQIKVTIEQSRLAELLAGIALSEYRVEKDLLLRDMAVIKKIIGYEGERSKLEDGKPCPLCGAAEHPFALGNVPVMDETEARIKLLTELIRKADQLEITIKELETAEKGLATKFAELDKQATAATNEKAIAETKISAATDELASAVLQLAELQRIVLEKLSPLGVVEIPLNKIAATLTSLKTRLKNWQERCTKKAELEKLIAELTAKVGSISAVAETHEAGLLEKQAASAALKVLYDADRMRRAELFGEKNPDKEERRLDTTVTDSEKTAHVVRAQYDESKQIRDATVVRIETITDAIAKITAELLELEEKFTGSITTAGFSDESVFLQNALPANDRDNLSKRAKTLDSKYADIAAVKTAREINLQQEVEKKITAVAIDDLRSIKVQLEENIAVTGELVGGLKQKLDANSAAKALIQGKQSLIEAQQAECSRWAKLNNYIGSADGKLFRNFAQGLTFELMVAHANKQLVKMSDRYLLKRDDAQPLELNVVDGDQAGEIRTTKNLSGGESFIVSLALALGLSKMASSKVRVDSLFLDEGFGTLDADALDTALETLAGLQQDGKLIGVISHVSALKERISTQIAIHRKPGGKSLISGPGCRRNTI
ncbi:MAG: AAA family ATPase [Bacillota bacterium]